MYFNSNFDALQYEIGAKIKIIFTTFIFFMWDDSDLLIYEISIFIVSTSRL